MNFNDILHWFQNVLIPLQCYKLRRKTNVLKAITQNNITERYWNVIHISIHNFGEILHWVHMGHSMPNRTVWKILIFDFLHFLTIFSTIKKLFLVNSEIFLITGLKDIELRFFAHNFFKNGTNSIFVFFWNFYFLYTF